MQNMFKLVLQGLLAVLPLALTLYALFWLASTLEVLCRKLLVFFFPTSWYFPGLGMLVGLGLLIAIGLLMNVYGMRYLVSLGSRVVQKIPLAKSIHDAIGDIITVFNIGKRNDLSSVVSLDMGNGLVQIGFVTGKETGKKLFPNENRVGVYLPMSYQIGGFTIYVDRDRLTPLDISIEEAMRIALTGGAQEAPKETMPTEKTPAVDS